MSNDFETNFEKVENFMLAFGQAVKVSPELADFNTAELRFELIAEEVQELSTAIDNDDIVEIADALTDILYVVYGAGHAYGIDLDDCFNEVHRSNMSKLGENGKPIYREDGKVLKGPGYSPPDLESIIF
jgi:predicted HAD superfamily Cof-like phosphohydrolase